ncbi:transposable element Tcb2 transposase, partial [Trichophaea hybrida]
DTVQWQAQSPDLNLIEALWMDMETELGETWGRIGDIPILEACLTAVWKAIPEERLEDLIRSIPQRSHAIIDAEGGATPY